MQPEKVNSSKFTVSKVVYNSNSFSIAYGTYQGETHEQLAMRWNGETEESIGHPNSRGHATWFLITADLTDVLLTALLNNKASKKKDILNILLKR